MASFASRVKEHSVSRGKNVPHDSLKKKRRIISSRFSSNSLCYSLEKGKSFSFFLRMSKDFLLPIHEEDLLQANV